MERMTKRLEGDLPWVDEGAVQAVEGGYTGPAVEKLAKLEELCANGGQPSRCSSPGSWKPCAGQGRQNPTNLTSCWGKS